MSKKETLEEFVKRMALKPSTYGYDAILSYDRFRANRLLFQEYVDRFDSSSYFEPLTSTVVITPGSQWEKMVDHVLDKPRLSFENSSIAHSRADLTMRITGGKQLTLSRAAGAKVKKLIRVKEADALDGPALHLRISLDASPGSVSQAGTVSLDLKKADHFYLSFADTDEENLLGGERYRKIFDTWPDEKKIFVLNELQIKESDFLQPEKFWVRTHAAPHGAVKDSDEFGEGEVLVFVTMKGSNNEDAGIPADDDSMRYLLPDAPAPYTMNLLLGNKFLIRRLVTLGFDKLEHLSIPLTVAYTGGEEETFITGIRATMGQLTIPVKGPTSQLKEVSFTKGLGLSFAKGDDEAATRFSVTSSGEKLNFEWSGKGEAHASITQHDNRTHSGGVSYRWEYNATYQFYVETAGEDIGHLTLQQTGTPRLRHKMAPSQGLAEGQKDPYVMEEFIDYAENALKTSIENTINTIISVAREIEAFRLNGLLFRSGKESAQPSAVRFPGDLTLPGYLSPARTQFEVVPNEFVMMAGAAKQFTTTLESSAAVTWTVENLPGEEDEDCGSFNPAKPGEYIAPTAASGLGLRSGKRIIITATSGASFSKALVSIVSRSIAVAPMVMQAAKGGEFKLSAATENGEEVSFTLAAGAKGSLKADPEPDPTVQQGMLYVAPSAKTEHEVIARKSDAWRRLRATPAWRIEDDLAEVLAVDTVEISRVSGGAKEQIPVLLPLNTESNWFTHEVEGDGVRLTFWGNGKKGDYVVPAEDTTWYLVLGNGTFKDGLYTPIATDGKPLSNYAVVAAIEENNHLWLWTYAILPIPFITPEVLIEKLTEEEGEEGAAPGMGGAQ